MRFSFTSAVLLAATTLTGEVFAANKHEKLHHNAKRAHEGVNGIAGNACARREVRDLARNNWDQWTLFLLALQRFMDQDQNDKYSYYQIAGIHSRPFTPWGDHRRVRNTGDCPHGSPVFMPWHAPYLALFEKVLDDHLTAVINSYPQASRGRWEAAHNCFRLPYWDSARRDGTEDVAPILLWAETVTLETPSGRRTIPNPLAAYNFHPAGAELGDIRWQQMTKTYRRVINPGPRASSNTAEMRQLLNQEQPTVRTRIADVMRDIKLYRLFSTEVWGQGTLNPERHDSGENIHNSVHNIVGGPTGGHMYYLEYSAFEPIFWLHHANIDRWNSIWRKINPNSYMESSRALSDTSFISRGDTLDWNTPLLPFVRDSRGTPWTGNDVRWTESSFSYFYPETAPGSTAQSAQSDVVRLYGSGSRRSRKRSLRPLADRVGEIFEGYAPAKGDYDFTSVVTCDKFAFEGSYSIHFYLDNDAKNNGTSFNSTAPLNGTYYGTYYGTAASDSYESPSDGGYGEGAYGSIPDLDKPTYDSENPATLPFKAGYVGTHPVLSSAQKQDKTTLTTAYIPLLNTLQKHHDAGLLPDLSEESCKKYLKDHLTWRVVKSGNVEVPAAEVPNLEISVIAREVLEPQTDTSFATYAPAKVLSEVTLEKPAGYAGGAVDNVGNVIDYVINDPKATPAYVDQQCPVAEPEVKYEYVDEHGRPVYGSMGAAPTSASTY